MWFLIVLARFRSGGGPVPWRPLLHVAIAGAFSAVWVTSFTQEGGYILMANPFRLGALIAMSPLSAFRQTPYRILLALPAAAVTVLGIVRFAKDGRSKMFARDSALAITAVICVVLFAVAPFQINHGGYFYERFPIFALAFMTAFASGLALRPRAEHRLTVALGLLAAVCLSWQVVMKHRIIQTLGQAYDAPPAPVQRKAVVLAAEPWMKWPGAPVNFDPYIWAGLHYLRRSKAIFLNSAWLDAPISMLEPAAPHYCSFSDPFPMAECLWVQKRSMPAPDLAIAVNENRGAPDPIPTDRLAKSLGLVRLPIKAGFLSFYGRR